MNHTLYRVGWVSLLILLLSAFLYQAMPLSIKNVAWVNNVLRNWDEYGFSRLAGQLVYNPGGIADGESPAVYSGHRPFGFYPSYLVRSIFGIFDGDGMVFYVLFTLLVALSIWSLLGEGSVALATLFAAVFSPGYVRNGVASDGTMAIPILFGLPVAVCAIKILRRPVISKGMWLAFSLLLAAYASLNWSTVFAFTIMLACLFLDHRIPRRRVMVFSAIVGISVATVTSIALIHKLGGGGCASFGSKISVLYNTYFFGAKGYGGYPMTWSKAMVRLCAVNLIGLLPLVACCAACLTFSGRWKKTLKFKSLMPALVALMTVGGMRNYFAHHPWVAAPVLMVGLILSMTAWIHEEASTGFTERSSDLFGKGLWRVLLICGTVFYCYAVILFFKVNSSDQDALISLIWKNSRRHDVVVVSHVSDPQMADNIKRWSELFDRKMMTLEDWNAVRSVRPYSGMSACQLTSARRLDAHGFIAQSGIKTFFGQIPIQRLLNWYRVSIARREAGDRLQIEATYYLYRLE